MEDDIIKELDDLTILITSKEWGRYKELLNQRKTYLQKEANSFVRMQDLINAYASIKKMDDIDKWLTILTDRLNYLKNGGK